MTTVIIGRSTCFEIVSYSASYTDYTGNILGPITTTSGEITAVYAQRDIRGDITSATDIGIISTVGGDIGQSGNLVDITVSGNGDNIEWVRGRSVYANITTSNTAAVRGDTKLITTTVGDFVGSLTTFAMQGTAAGIPAIDIAGDLDAVISVNTIKRPVNIAGDLVSGASITLSGASRDTGPFTILGDIGGLLSFNTTTAGENDADITVGSIGSGGEISVNRDMDGVITVRGDMAGTIDIGTTADNKIDIWHDLSGIIRTGPSGLVNQINVNSNNSGGEWKVASTVTIGTITLTNEPHYPQTGLGGGAVGLVAFDCHFEDCVPDATSSTPGVLGSSSSNVAFHVTLTHYGPVTWTSDMPIQVLFCAAGTECDPTDVTSDFEVTSSEEQRFIVVEPKAGKPAAGEYHLSPKVDVKCFGISAGTPPSVVSYTYDLEFNMN